MVTSPSPARAMNRLVHSMASALSRYSISAQPPTSSLASVNGPSSTVNSPSRYRTLIASSSGPAAPAVSSTPALVASAMNSPILAMSSGVGGAIGADGSPRVYERYRMVVLLFGGWRRSAAGFRCPHVERRGARSTRAGEFLRTDVAEAGNIGRAASVATHGGSDAALFAGTRPAW